MKWDQSKKLPHEKNKRRDSNLLIPIGVGIACWFIAHNYFENYNFIDNGINTNNTNNLSDKLDFTLNIPTKIEDTMAGGANLINNIGNNMMPSNINVPNIQSYHVLKRGVTIPDNINMPDVLLENF